MDTFYLGSHRPHWLGRVDVPLFISHRTLRERRSLPQASAPWALDSGAFSELAEYGEWRTDPAEYAEAVARYSGEIGQMSWAAPMDWMCEPFMVERTGLSVEEHQERTVQNYLDLEGPFIPVLQGWTLGDYERCVGLYAAAGVNLSAEPVVGLGSVCRRQNEGEIGQIVRFLHGEGISVHGFGVKLGGLRKYGHFLTSADSMAWSYSARRNRPLPGCSHKSCSNCLRYALRWRQGALGTQTALEFAA